MNRSTVFTSLVVIAFAFLTLFTYTKLVGPIPLHVTSVVTQKTDVFSVTGEGKTVMQPDIAYVAAGVEAQGSNVRIVQDEINTKSVAIADAVKGQGIGKDDIQTTNYNINPTYDYSEGKQRPTGYRANTSFRIKVRNIDKINDVIDIVTQSGATSVGGVQFDVDDRERALTEARQKAVADAKKKAAGAAQAAGFSLGKLINYYENTPGTPVYYGGINMARSSAEIAETKLEPGSMEIAITVSLSYELQ